MNFDAWKYRYASKRTVVYGKKGMVCTSQPLAAQAGLDALKRGGNAIDAAIAAAACLTVLEPTGNGLGSDVFALVWTGGKLHGLNGSGFAPTLLTAEKMKALGHEEMPTRGWETVTVPGAPASWAALANRFGKLPLSKALEPAITYAEEGYPVSPTIAGLWRNAHRNFAKELRGDAFEHWFDTFTFAGQTPSPGTMVRLPDHAATLRALAATACESFYRGELAAKIDAFSKATGGYIRKEDLAAYEIDWMEPIHVHYKGYDVWEMPPNGHGIVALMALNILRDDAFAARDSADSFHRQIEAMKLAYTDGKRYVADPDHMKMRVEQLLSVRYAAERRALIGETALLPQVGDPSCGGTVYLCTADGQGNMVSYIQSNYNGFGSGIVIPGTGIALNNRARNFSLDETMENYLMPKKRPYHTIIPGFLTKDGNAVGPFGVMGGFMQPQGHLQVVINTVDFHMNPQEALDAPRWQWSGGKEIQVERSFPAAVTEELIRRGHQISVLPESTKFGRGQIIWRGADGVLVGATEPRTDGMVAAW